LGRRRAGQDFEVELGLVNVCGSEQGN
jgi:hypothetical protein